MENIFLMFFNKFKKTKKCPKLEHERNLRGKTLGVCKDCGGVGKQECNSCNGFSIEVDCSTIKYINALEKEIDRLTKLKNDLFVNMIKKEDL